MSNTTRGISFRFPRVQNIVLHGHSSTPGALPLPTRQAGKETAMHDANTYRHYAADCRRLAQTMSKKDGKIMLKMAEAWDSRADEAERVQRKKSDGKGQHQTK